MNKKKLLALLMALVMTLTLVPVTAFATEYPTNATEAFESDVANVTPGGTVTLTGDVTYGTTHSVAVWDNGFNLDLGGHTFTTNSEVEWTASNNGYKTSAICFGDNTGDYVNASVRNGTIHTSYGAGIYADGAVIVTLSDLDVAQNYTEYVQITDEYSSAIRLTSKAKVIVESGTYTGKNAIAVSNSGGEITINGGTFTGDIFFSNSTNKNLTAADKKITINGGTFNGDFVNTDKGTLVIKGGTFDHNPTAFVAPGYIAVNNGGNTWTVGVDPATAVARIGETYFTTLQAAINAAESGATVTLLQDVTGNFTINKSLTLEAINGAQITGTNTTDTALLVNVSNVEVSLINVVIKKGAGRGVGIDQNCHHVTLNISGGSIAANSYALDTRPGADNAAVTINGTGLDGWAAMNIWGNNSTFEITGSELLGANTATQSSSNDFAVIALEADTSARASGHALAGQYADGNTITLTNCTIGATTTANQQAIIVYNAYGEDNNKPSRPNAATYLATGNHAKNNTVCFDGCNVNTAGNLIYDGASVLAGQDGTTISAAYNNKFIVKTSGTYTSDPTAFVAPGYKAVDNGNETWTVGVDPDTAVARIGETYFTTLDAALEAANNGDTIVLLANIEYNTTSNLNITKSVTIDGQGTYAVSGGMEGGTAGTGVRQQYGPIVIWPNETLDSVTLQNLTIAKTAGNTAFLTAGANNTYLTNVIVTAESATGIYSAEGVTTLVNCEVVNTGENSGASFRNAALQASGGSELVIKSGNYESGNMVMNTLTSGGLITVEGGTFSGKIYVYNTTDNYWNTYGQGVITIKGGTFNNVSFELAGGTHPGKIVITGGTFDADPSAFVADGYEAVALTGDNAGKWQVGKVKATELHETNSTEATKTFTASKNVVDKNDNIIPSDSNTTFTVTVIEGTKDPYGTTDTVSLNNVKMEEVVALAVDKANESNTNNAAEVSAYVTVQLAKGSATVESTKATFEVHPEAVITVGETETKVPLTNDQIKGSFSFALDVDDVFPNSTDFVVVHVHEDGTKENLGVFTKDSHGEITLSNIKQFSDFEVSPLVLSNDDSGDLYFEGGSLRRRVKTINGQLTDEVIKGFTDFRFGYQIMDYDASNQEVSYYFQWSKDGVNWSKAISATNIDAQGHVSLVITSVPQSWYGNNLYSRLYKVDADGNVTMSGTNGRTVDQVADYYIDYHTQFELRWVNYAKLLRGGNGVDSYYVVRDAQTNAIIGHKLNSSDEMISDGTMSQ